MPCGKGKKKKSKWLDSLERREPYKRNASRGASGKHGQRSPIKRKEDITWTLKLFWAMPIRKE